MTTYDEATVTYDSPAFTYEGASSAATLIYSTGSENLIGYVLVEDGITIKRGKQNAFGATEPTTCSFTANRSIMKSAAWRNSARTTETIQLTVNASVRFTGWWWTSDEDPFDDRGLLHITLASTTLKNMILDQRELNWSTRILASSSLSSGNIVAYCPVDPTLIDAGKLLDDSGFGVAFGATVRPTAANATQSGANKIKKPSSSVPQLYAGDRCAYTSDARLALFPASPVSPPFSVSCVVSTGVTNFADGASTTNPVRVWTEHMSFRWGSSPLGNVSVVVRDEDAGTALVNVTVPWSNSRNAEAGEVWFFNLAVTESGGNVTTVLTCYPLSRDEGNQLDYAGTVLVNDTSAAPTAGVGQLQRVEFGPYVPGLYQSVDTLISDIVISNIDSAPDPLIMANACVGGRGVGGLATATLQTYLVSYYGATTANVNAGTYALNNAAVPSGTGADALAAVEEIYRTVIREDRTADFTTIRTYTDYLPVQVTELALGDDYRRGEGQAGEEGSLDSVVPTSSYGPGVGPYGAEWQARRSRKWVRLPVNLDSATKRSVDVATSFVSFYTRPGNLFRGRVVGIEEHVTVGEHMAYWVLEEWPHKGQLQADTATAREPGGTALAATVNAPFVPGPTVTVDATYSAYDTPFTVRPAAASKYFLIVASVSGTTWTISGASSPPPSMAVGDLLVFDSAAIAF